MNHILIFTLLAMKIDTRGCLKKKKNLSHQNVKKEGSQKCFDFNGSNITTVTIIALSQAMVIQFF